jgi:hypothetical protein
MKACRMNKIDFIIATNICSACLCLLFVSELYLFYLSKALFLKVVILILSMGTFVYLLRVMSKRFQRVRVYNILNSRVNAKGYSKEVFEGKCQTVCAFAMASYFAIRHQCISDILYFYEQFSKGKSLALHENEDIENALNEVVFK